MNPGILLRTNDMPPTNYGIMKALYSSLNEIYNFNPPVVDQVIDQ